ncbi:hypothetical protein [Algibacter sp. L1A34]|uniref:hypothetical protein n=1 Tax=Algibacter sp. L1A34 TaxID=2686365 RepID=UPI00131D777D|nr:hypothetical protein [Algibacter sp. L1A34]
MKKLIFLILIISIVFAHFDGQDRKYSNSRDVLQSTNLLESFSKKVKFTPEEPVVIVTDTILSSGFEVKLKYNSIENNFISNIIAAEDQSAQETLYKDFEAELKVLIHGELITEGLINKGLFKNYANTEFWKHAIMQHVWIDHEHSTEQYVQLNTSFRVLETETYKDFSILINSLGSIEIKEINLLSNTI